MMVRGQGSAGHGPKICLQVGPFVLIAEPQPVVESATGDHPGARQVEVKMRHSPASERATVTMAVQVVSVIVHATASGGFRQFENAS
jgi:hypothetical protein